MSEHGTSCKVFRTLISHSFMTWNFASQILVIKLLLAADQCPIGHWTLDTRKAEVFSLDGITTVQAKLQEREQRQFCTAIKLQNSVTVVH